THAAVTHQLGVFSGTFAPKRPHSGFQEVIQGVLGHLDRHHGPEAVVEVLGPWAWHLKTFFPQLSLEEWLVSPVSESEAVPEEVLKERVLETVVRILTAAAEVDARIIVLEDLHFGDDIDLEILHRLIINAIQLPILVITTHRPDLERRLTGMKRLLNEIRAEERLQEIEMRSFDSTASGAMVESMLAPARRAAPEFVEVLQERTDGVPLYLMHFINSLWKRNLIRLEGPHWTVDTEDVRALPIPETTRSHFLLVLDEAPSAERKVLNLAAVIGTEFSFDTLLSVLDMDEFKLDSICRNLAHAGILEERQDGFRFLHSFEQEIILSQLSQPMLRRLHARVGQVLEEHHAADLEAHVGEVGEHFYQGGVAKKAFQYLQKAARLAQHAYAYRTALDYYGKALQLAPKESTRRRILITLGDLHQKLGELDLALDSYRVAQLTFPGADGWLLDASQALSEAEREDLQAFSQLLLKFGEVFGLQSDFHQALEYFRKSEQIAQRLDDTPGLALSQVRQGVALIKLEDFAGAEQMLSSAVQLYGDVPPSRGLIRALVGLSYLNRMRVQMEAAVQNITQALGIARQLGDQAQLAKLLNTYGTLNRSMGRYQEAEQSFEQCREISERLGDQRLLAICIGNLGRLYICLGEYRKGLETFTRCREIFRAVGDREGQLNCLGNLGTLHFYQGNYDTARELLTEYLTIARRRQWRRYVADALSTLGLLELETGCPERADTCFRESLQKFEEAGDQSEKLRLLAQTALLRLRQERIEEALELCEQVLQQAEAIRNHEAVAEAKRVTAEALWEKRNPEELERAARLALEALETYQALTFPFQEGLCCVTLAKIYRDMGYYWADHTGKYFEKALRIFQKLGAKHALAVTQLEYGIFLGLVDEVEPARELFAKAASLFEALDTREELARVHHELEEISP
ncbi:MAG: tetratricopeptide repeat protein, partial [Planctomycetota bacterium]